MDKFTASNGVSVKLDGALLFGDSTHTTYVAASESQVQALREFFQAERDEELGRWRPEGRRDVWALADSDDPNRVLVVSDKLSTFATWTRDGIHQTSDNGGWAGDIARDYFDAHPERKPWHDADAGEVWMFGDEHNPNLVLAWRAREGWDVIGPNQEVVSGVNDPVVWTASIGRGEIADGRRIWSEDAP